MDELYEELQALNDGAGDFACSGYLPELPALPGLYIKEVGNISLPVQEEQATKIIAVAKKAPFGLGEKTVVDESVRKSWQLDPKQIAIKNKQFSQGVKRVVATVKEKLGCNKKAVEALLYKVLLYEKGGHFKAHRDTEKEKGMFATMIIQLPSVFQGGKLIVRHGGKEKVVEFDDDQSSYCCQYAAHYSDCEHEITEIQSGYRLALVYSLCWNATGAPPSADASNVIIQNIARILPSICTEVRKKFSWFLAHKYTSAGLTGSGATALKGHDACVAKALQAADELLPEDQKFQFHITMVERQLEQFGDCYESSDGSCSDFMPNGDEEEMINIESEWYKLNGAKQKMGSVSIDVEDEVVNYQCPPNMDANTYKEGFWGEADDEENTGPTGNEGATQTYWYRSYAIFAWPKTNSISMMCESGYPAAVSWLVNEFSQVQDVPATHPCYEKAVAHLKAVLNFAVSKPVSLNRDAVCSLLTVLAGLRAEAAELSNLFLTRVMAKEVIQNSWSPSKMRFCLGDDALIPSLVNLAVTVGWLSICDAILKMFQVSPASQHGRWAVFLKKLLEKMNESRSKILGENGCFTVMLASLVDAVQSSALRNKIDSADDITWVSKTGSLLFLFNDAELLDNWTKAVLVHSHQSPSGPLLERLIETLSEEGVLVGASPFWLKLLQLRIKQLEKVEQEGTRPFSWCQDDAVIQGHPRVQAFLRGPQQSLRYQQFTGIGHARNWANKHFGRESRWGSVRTSHSYSARVTTAGIGQKAYALVEKTREWYDKKMVAIQHQMQDLRKLRAMVNAVTNNNDLTAEQLPAEPAAKKRALSTICID